MVVPAPTPYGEVEALVREAAGPYLESLVLFDLYQGPPLPEGHKSLAFHLRFRHPKRTLRDEEVEEAVSRVAEALRARGFGLRGLDTP